MPKTAPAIDMARLIAGYNEAKAKQATAAGFVRLQDGENLVRLTTFTNEETGKGELYVQYTSHFLTDQSVACLKMFGEPNCPVCDYIAQLKKRDMGAVAKKIAPKQRFYFNVLAGGEMKVLEVGRQIWDQIMAFFADAEYGNIADTETGCNIKINKSGSGLTTEYKVMASRNPSAVKLPGDPKDLNQLVVRHDAEELEEILYARFERLEDGAPPPASEGRAGKPAPVEREAPEQGAEDDFAPPPEKEAPRGKQPTRAEQEDWAKETFGPGKGKAKPVPAPSKGGKPSPARPGKR